MLRKLPVLAVCLLASCAPAPVTDTTIEAPAPAPVPPVAEAVTPVQAPPVATPVRNAALDVLVLGDSQISSGAGPSYLNFFGDLGRMCSGSSVSPSTLAQLGKGRIRAVGVRSTALHSWTARDGAPKGTICDVDQKFGVNAAAFGNGAPAGKRYIQIGQEPGFNYCKAGRAAFETVFEDAGNAPNLLILSFLGNAQQRWAGSQSAADNDVRTTLQQIPQGVPCIIMTTAPVFSREANDQRMIAQENLARAVAKFGGQCQLVKGLNTQTRAVIEGQPAFFRKNEEGEVVDPLHPSRAAADIFFKLNAPRICNAIAAAL